MMFRSIAYTAAILFGACTAPRQALPQAAFPQAASPQAASPQAASTDPAQPHRPTSAATSAPDLHLQRANQYLHQQRPDLAIPEFAAAVAADPGNTDAQANLGVLLYFRQEFAEALPHLQTAVQQKPDLYKVEALLGLAEYRLGKTADAQRDLEAALPHLAGEKVQIEVGDVLVETYTAARELEKAASAVSLLLQSRPTDTRLLWLSYRLHSDLASSSLVTLALADPHSAEMHQVMARELTRHGDEAAALANYREAVRINPNLPGLFSEYGNLLYHSTDAQLQTQAEAQFRLALARNPSDVKSQLLLGEIAAKRGDLQAAYEADSRAVTLAPDDTDACTALAKLLLARGDLDEAGRLLHHAVELDPTDFTAHYRLATLDRRQGRTEDARRELAEYQKYKDLKTKLQATFHDMRMNLDAPTDDAPDPRSDESGKQ